MKKFQNFLLLLIIGIFFINVKIVSAQTNPPIASPSAGINELQQDEKTGQRLFNDLQNKKISCQQLTNENYEKLGEYFMGQSLESIERHAAINNMMQSMMGEQGEEQMHIAMGKRLSNCDPAASIPPSGSRFMPMFLPQEGGVVGMMGWGYGPMSGWMGAGYGIAGLILMVLFWVLVIVGIIALIRYLTPKREEKTKPLEILQERYARGEIDKKEYEEKKKELR